MTACLSEQDRGFFQDVYNLMKEKYPEMAKTFGIWRIHQHFDLKEGEVFHETSNLKAKESTLRIIKKEALPKGAFASTWKLTPSGPKAATWCCDDQPIS